MSRTVVAATTSMHKLQPPEEPSGRRAGSIDAEIGLRMRRLRNSRQLSQEELAARIGISCQQLQKYESGANRVSASRLVQLADALSVEISLFLRDATAIEATQAADARNPASPDGQEMLTLMTAFCSITNAASREKIIEMARFLAGLELGGGSRSSSKHQSIAPLASVAVPPRAPGS